MVERRTRNAQVSGSIPEDGSLTHYLIMISQELLQFIREENAYLLEKYPPTTPAESMYGRMIKLTEEVGELAAEILALQGHQRTEKLRGKNTEQLVTI